MTTKSLCGRGIYTSSFFLAVLIRWQDKRNSSWVGKTVSIKPTFVISRDYTVNDEFDSFNEPTDSFVLGTRI